VLVTPRATGQAVAVIDEPMEDPAALTERERAIIGFEATWWSAEESRTSTIRARFACSEEEYYQQLNRLLDHPGALSFDPLVVRRLRRQRERRRRARIDGQYGTGEQA
jgi:hypothetical protein